MKAYNVLPGDNLSKIAKAHGLSNWRELYFHPANASFRQLRSDPNLIYPGDKIMVPDREEHPPANRQNQLGNTRGNQITDRRHEWGINQSNTLVRNQEPIESVKFWINAFIPSHVESYTLIVPGGPHSGETMIPGPFFYSDCFLTDQRGFDNNIHASSRMHSEVRISFASSPPSITQWHNCDMTHECDCDDGTIECAEKGDTSGMRFVTLRSRVSRPGIY